MSRRRHARVMLRKALSKLRNVNAEREQASLSKAIELLEALKDGNFRDLGFGGHHPRIWSGREYMEALIDALEGDDPDAVLDAYDAACEALGRPPDELGEWIDDISSQ